MKIEQKFMTKNKCYLKNVKFKPTKLVLHSTGTPQPKNSAYYNNWNKETVGIGVHAIIGSEGVWQTLPWDCRGGHVGDGPNGSYNSYSIGVEICEPNTFKYSGGATMVGYDVKQNIEYFDKVYKEAVELFAYLCKIHNLNPLKDIYCHSEVHKLGYGSNHGDVMHWFPKHNKTMDKFRKDVYNMMYSKPTKSITKESSKEDIKWLQSRLNELLKGKCTFIPLTADGIYGNKTRIALLILWEVWGWNKDGSGTGWVCGKKTLNKL